MVTSRLVHGFNSVGILCKESNMQGCQSMGSLLINQNQTVKTYSKLTVTGRCHSCVPLCVFLGKQAFDLAVKLGPLVLLW